MKELKFPIPKEERTEVFKHIKGHNLYSLSVMEKEKERRKKKRLKSQQERLNLDVRKNFLMTGIIKNRLPGEWRALRSS